MKDVLSDGCKWQQYFWHKFRIRTEKLQLALVREQLLRSDERPCPIFEYSVDAVQVLSTIE
jgi:hypothetical protein